MAQYVKKKGVKCKTYIFIYIYICIYTYIYIFIYIQRERKRENVISSKSFQEHEQFSRSPRLSLTSSQFLGLVSLASLLTCEGVAGRRGERQSPFNSDEVAKELRRSCEGVGEDFPEDFPEVWRTVNKTTGADNVYIMFKIYKIYNI